ncbi:MAG: hypothetical protein K6E38_05195 [Fretibacterium sp.]|nr:hypothetical protein [Fretibacterium sp.]
METRERSVESGVDDREASRRAEECLYGYRLNLSRLRTLRGRLGLLEASPSNRGVSYERYGGGVPGDPVAKRMERIDRLERQIAELESRTEPITRMLEDLREDYGLESSRSRELFQLLELRYFAGGTWPEIAVKLGVSETALKRRRRHLLRLAMDYFCL